MKKAAVLWTWGLLLAVSLRGSVLAQEATLLQQFFVMKAFAPNLERVGVLVSSDRGEAFKDKLGRASAAVGVKAVVTIVGNLHELSKAYQELVDVYQVRFIWVPSDDPVLRSDVAREYLVKKSVTQGVGILAPDKSWVMQGATLFVGVEGEKVKPFYNSKSLQALGLSVPEKYADVSTAASE
ncbi:MAG: hypothetical protein ONB23_10885 [candidate division KSB1 bacterium]|nr:hypothetical protein [candidate division KSB1 bacterium]